MVFCFLWYLDPFFPSTKKTTKKRCQSWCFSVKVSSRGQRSRVQNFSAFHCLLIENSSQRCPSSWDKFSDILCQGHSERPIFTITFELRRAISSNNVVFWQVQTQISLLNSNFGQYLNHSIVKRLTKALIRLRVCAGWFEPLLVARKYHVAAQLSPILEIIHIHVNTPCYRASVEPQFADTKVRSKDGKKSRYKCFPCIESKHLMLWLVLLGACADPGFFAGGGGGGGGEGGSGPISRKQLWQLFQSSALQRVSNGYGGVGGPNANFYRNPYNLWFSRGGGGPDPLPPSGSAHGETVRVHMPIFWAFVACKCDKYTDTSCLERRLQWANDQL